MRPSPNISPLSADPITDAGSPLSPVSVSDPASARGVELQLKHPWLAELIELISSIRFLALAFFIIGLTLVVSAVVPQHAPALVHIERMGEFWAGYFYLLGFLNVHNAFWFLLLMALLALSSGLCVVHNTPRMLREFRSWNDEVSDQSFSLFRYRSEADIKPAKTRQSMAQIRAFLVSKGYQLRERRRLEADMPALVAKKGGASRIGYLLTHIAVIVIAVGGLFDSHLPVKISGWWHDKAPVESLAPVSQNKEDSARLPATTPSYRANTKLAEGARTGQAFVAQGQDTFVLDLPFSLELKKFRVEYHPTGMPKLFSSDVALTDKQSGDVKIVSVEADKPLVHDGIAIHQSSYGEGGSRLTLVLHPLAGELQAPSVLSLGVGENAPLLPVENNLTLEILAMTPVNLQSAGNFRAGEKPKDLGPSVTYRLKQQGVTQEFQVFMLPVEWDASRVFLAGVKAASDKAFRYLRIPADHKDSLEEFMRIRSALAQDELRELAARRFAAAATTAAQAPALADRALRALNAYVASGLSGFVRAAEQAVAVADRERAAEVALSILGGTLWELWQAAREKDELPSMLRTEANTRFVQQSLVAYSDVQAFNAPVLVTLRDVQEVRASVFQVTRSPGRFTVYAGGVLLVIGLLAMLVVQERRVWVWVNQGQYGDNIKIALSTSRETFNFRREFSSIARVIEELRFHQPDELVQRKFKSSASAQKT